MSRDLRVVFVDPNTREVSLAIPTQPQYITGMDLLIQIVALAYLSNPGQDVNAIGDGSGVRDEIGQIDAIGEDQLKADFVTRTAKIENEIIGYQSSLDLPSNERLKALTIQGISVDSGNLQLNAQVLIENQASQSRVVRV